MLAIHTAALAAVAGIFYLVKVAVLVDYNGMLESMTDQSTLHAHFGSKIQYVIAVYECTVNGTVMCVEFFIQLHAPSN